MPSMASLQEKQEAREEQLADLQEQVQALQHRRRSLEGALKAAEQVRAHGGLLVPASLMPAHSSTMPPPMPQQVLLHEMRCRRRRRLQCLSFNDCHVRMAPLPMCWHYCRRSLRKPPPLSQLRT